MIVCAIEGVLRDPQTREVIPSGRVLYRALSDNYGMALLADDLEADQMWLRSHGFVDHNFEVTGSRADQISKIRQRGSVDFVVEGSPDKAAALLSQSLPVLFFALPAYSAAAFQPGATRVPSVWGSLLEEAERQHINRAEDLRLADMQEIL